MSGAGAPAVGIIGVTVQNCSGIAVSVGDAASLDVLTSLLDCRASLACIDARAAAKCARHARAGARRPWQARGASDAGPAVCGAA